MGDKRDKSSPKYQVEMLLVRMVLNQAIVPPAPQPLPDTPHDHDD